MNNFNIGKKIVGLKTLIIREPPVQSSVRLNSLFQENNPLLIFQRTSKTNHLQLLMRHILSPSILITLWQKKVERIRRIPSHGVAALRAFGIDRGNPFRDCIDSLLIDL